MASARPAHAAAATRHPAEDDIGKGHEPLRLRLPSSPSARGAATGGLLFPHRLLWSSIEQDTSRLLQSSLEQDPSRPPQVFARQIQKRKAKSSDPKWKYGFWPEIGNRDLVECILCGTRVKSGIKRLKEHLVGGYGDALKCEKTTTAIAAEMDAALVMGRRRRALNLDDDDGVQVVEIQNNVNASSQSSGTTVQHPSSGTASKRKQSTLKFASVPPRPKEKKSVITMLRKKPEEVVEERHSKNGPAQSSVEGRIRTKEERDEVNMHVANFF
ncbi:unnamed protein product [Miscanthus lutarioriparius]|uniref:BED-type domain-containing protein n=1 Tax=Miscanthus lutarioriparius TaxID=422564 RepID=A0A811R1I1_9POAL|nr:unnamed protein product [Miscanthus lutarioriparius]